MLLSFPLMSTSLYAADATENNAQEDQVEVIEVTGIVGSLRRAEAIKLSAKSIVEVISAEDLGQFSDDSIAQALQRLPGVQVEEDTSGSAGDKVSIRGLGSQFVVATINGRPAWGSGDGEGKDLRSFNFNVIPGEVVSQVVVIKTPVADTVESGIGGSVDMQTLRPLDANFKDKNWIGQLEARIVKTDIGEANWGERFSGAYIAKNAEETFGGYVAFNWSDTETGKDRMSARFREKHPFYIDHNNNFLPDDNELYDGVTHFRDLEYSPDRYKTEKGAVNVALQWMPTDNLNIVADVLYTKSENINHRPNARFDIDRVLDKDNINGDDNLTLFAPDGIQLEDGGLGGSDDAPYHTTFMDGGQVRCTNEDTFERFTGTDCTESNGRLLTLRDQYRNNFQDSWIGGLNVKYDNGPWQISGDIFYNRMETEVNEISIEANTYNFENAIALDIRGSSAIPAMHTSSELVAQNFEARRIRVRQRTNEGEQIGVRLDFTYELDNDLVESVQFGGRYNTSEFDYVKSQRAEWACDEDECQDGLDAAMRTTGFNEPAYGMILPAFDLGAARDYLEGLGGRSAMDGGTDEFGPCVAGTVGPYINLNGRADTMLTDECKDLQDTFAVDEDTYNAYVSADLAFDIGDFPVYANIGLRYVKTENTAAGVIAVQDPDDDDDFIILDPIELTVTKSSFTEVLPSLNVQVDLTETLQLRLAASKSLSRPDLYDLSPRYKLSINDGEDDIFDPQEDCVEISDDCKVKQGNPDLKPYTAWNYDATIMWTMPTDGFLAASIYYKDIKDFIFENKSASYDVPGHVGSAFTIERPENASSATVEGFEIALHQPFTFLPAPFDGFGIQANYSYTDSQFASDLPEDIEKLFGQFALPGASKNNANGVLYFETDNFSARIAYVYRDAYFSSFTGGSSSTPRFFAESEKVSASISYKINDHLKIKVQGSNLTEDDKREFTSYDTLTTRYTSSPKSYSVSLTGKF